MANRQPQFRFDPSDMLSRFAVMESRVPIAIHMYAETAAQKLQGSARQHAPWTDRTGHARQRLTCTVEGVEKGYQLVLAHGVDYGKWLELAHEKRFATIEPSIKREGPSILKGFERLLERL